MESNAVVVR